MLRATSIVKCESLIPGVHEKFVHRMQMAVPRTDTGALAEKAKTCKV